MTGRRGLRLLVIGWVGVVAGCASIPNSGTVHVGGIVNAQDPGLGSQLASRYGSPPTNNMTQQQVVRGFLESLAAGDTEVAGEYLGPAAQLRWRPQATVTAYDDESIKLAQRGRTVVLRAREQGQLTPTGEWQPRDRRLTVHFGLDKVDGQWRISALPSLRLYDDDDLSEQFAEYSLQFLNRAGTRLVPQSVVLAPNAGGLETILLQRLLAGPSPSTAGAVSTAIPASTQLYGNVGVDDTGTVAEVDLTSPIRALPAQRLQLAVAQIRQTLEQLPGIRAVRIDVEGQPLTVPGTALGGLIKPTTPTLTAVLAQGGGRVFSSVNPAIGRSWPAVTALALGPDGSAAGVAGAPGRQRLLIGPAKGRPRVTLRADAIGSLQYDGAAVTAVLDGTRVVTVHGRRRSDWRLPGAVTHVGIRALAISPDGVHVALLVGRPGAVTPQIGLVTSTDRLVDLHSLGRPAGVLTGVAWGGETAVALLSRTHSGSHLTVTDPVGFSAHRLQTPGHGIATAVCSNAGGTVAVVVNGTLWVQVDGWRPSGPAVGCA